MLRRFFINHEYNTCAGDSGWLVVVDRETDDCSWGTKGHFPSILYDPQRRVVTDEGKPRVAEALYLYLCLYREIFSALNVV